MSHNQHARYLYYEARVKAVQLNYAEAHSHALQALRKASEFSGKGFRVDAQKLAITIELLMGEIPDRSLFSNPGMKKELGPYF